MAEVFTEAQLKAIREKVTDRRRDVRYKVLSQEEVNTLLSAYESANAQLASQPASRRREKEVRLYDFAKPDRFCKEYLRALQTIHETFATELSTELASLYGAPTRVDLISMDQATYKQYRATVPAKALLVDATISPHVPDVLLAVNSGAVGVWVDYLCGGDGRLPAIPSELTAIDNAVATKVLEHVVRIYASTWPKSAQIQPRIVRVTDSESYGESKMPASDAVLVCSFEMQSGAAVGLLTVCLPAVGAEQMLPSASFRGTQPAAGQPETISAETTRALNHVSLPCRVVLGTSSVSLSEMRGLEVGDVLRTDKRVGDEAELWVGSRHLFNCRPGNQRGSIAVVVSGPAELESNDIRAALLQHDAEFLHAPEASPPEAPAQELPEEQDASLAEAA